MSPTPLSVVIIGGGLGGAKAAEALREQGFSGSITLISNEADAPYERPPLSKGYLAGRSPFEDALVHPLQWYAEHDVDLRLSTAATSFDRDEHTVTLSDGTTLPYDKLLLATGAVPRLLAVPGADAENVLYLRRHDDADAIRAAFGDGHRLVIIGAGWIGLEVAAAARDAGIEVAIVEMAELPLLGALGPEIASVFADLHTGRGVQLHLGAALEVITLDDRGRANGVRLADGTLIPADTVVIGIGVSPDVVLAEAAGLATDNGVLVDASLRTSDPDIFAVGDIANHAHPSLGIRVRVEHRATALKQPAVAVAAMLGCEDADGIYSELPYFFSDQYDPGMEYFGHAGQNKYHLVVRGDLASREFVAFWLDEANRIKAVMNVNVWDVIDAVKPLILAGTAVEPARLSDPQVAYGELAGPR
jgi:NADPH-dependent 2,4-dienoyl-CoA reductase/sulfur reductase-like enzyme